MFSNLGKTGPNEARIAERFPGAGEAPFFSQFVGAERMARPCVRTRWITATAMKIAIDAR